MAEVDEAEFEVDRDSVVVWKMAQVERVVALSTRSLEAVHNAGAFRIDSRKRNHRTDLCRTVVVLVEVQTTLAFVLLMAVAMFCPNRSLRGIGCVALRAARLGVESSPPPHLQ